MKRKPLTIEQHFEEKKASCIERMVKFDMTLEQWKTLMSMQFSETCAYTNLPFDNSKNGQRVSVERLSDELGYTASNVCLTTTLANQLKNDYVFLGKDTSKLNHTHKGYVHRIKKIFSTQDNIDKISAPYRCAFHKLENKNSVLIKQQNKEKAKQAAIEAENKKWEDEIMFAKHFITLTEELSQVGIKLQITLGALKKSLGRCNKCQVTGESFTGVESKWLFIIDKALPVTSENVKVVTRNTRNALDLLTKGCTIEKLALSLHKIQNKEK